MSISRLGAPISMPAIPYGARITRQCRDASRTNSTDKRLTVPFEGEDCCRSSRVRLKMLLWRCTSMVAQTRLSPWRKKLNLNDRWGLNASERVRWTSNRVLDVHFHIEMITDGQHEPFVQTSEASRKEIPNGEVSSRAARFLRPYFSIMLCNALNSIDRQSYDMASLLHDPCASITAKEEETEGSCRHSPVAASHVEDARTPMAARY